MERDLATHTIKNSVSTTVIANKANDTWHVTASGAIDTLTVGIDAGSVRDGRAIIVEGHVFGAAGEGAGRILIEKGGDVAADGVAILSRGDGQKIVNNGKVEAVDAIVSQGSRADFVNNGTIDGANTGIYLENGGGRIVNNGKMYGEAAIYAADGLVNGRITVINNGLMETTKGAIQLLTDGGHLIRNTGTINADVFGGDGRDRFINDGGKVTGSVDLGEGNDIYVVDRGNIHAREQNGGGIDTVRASASYTLGDYIEKLVLTGKAGIDGTGNTWDNRIQGNAGNNRIDGGGGDDLLKGAGGADVFVFSYHGLSDEILDFRSGQDRIDMRGWAGYGLESFNDVKLHATEVGGDLLISLGGSDDLLIHNFAKADLAKADFIF